VKKLAKAAKGQMLVILGPDGSGKSTLAKEIVKLGNSNDRFSDVEVFHFRPFRGASLGSVVSGGSRIVNGGRPYVAPPRSLAGSLIKIFYYMFEFIFGYVINVRPLLNMNKLVIFDRYFLDFGLDPKRFRIKLPSRMVFFLNWFIPQPDMYLFLVGDAGVLAERKGELSLEETALLTQRYACVGARYGLIIDTTDTTLAETVKKIAEPLTFNLS